jgi:uncharacterized membrane protein YeiB
LPLKALPSHHLFLPDFRLAMTNKHVGETEKQQKDKKHTLGSDNFKSRMPHVVHKKPIEMPILEYFHLSMVIMNQISHVCFFVKKFEIKINISWFIETAFREKTTRKWLPIFAAFRFLFDITTRIPSGQSAAEWHDFKNTQKLKYTSIV